MSKAISHKHTLNLGLVIAIIAIFLLLRSLTPDPSGIGTHRQIIPIPCLFHYLLGIPCPSCGMTTSLAYAVHGEWLSSLKAHPFGLPFLVLLLALLAQSLRGILFNKAWWRVMEKRWFENTLLCGIVAYIGTWIIRIL